MPSRHSTAEICVTCGVREDIPGEIRRELESIGGLEGLCTRLPPPEQLHLVSRVHHALSDPIRLKILYLLRVQPLCVCVIKHCIGIADSKLSYHLNVLKECGLIEGRAEKNWIIYCLTEDGRSCLERSSG